MAEEMGKTEEWSELDAEGKPYENWSKSALIRRLRGLEKAVPKDLLKSLELPAERTQEAAKHTPKSQEETTSGPRSISGTTRLIALKLSYLGANYSGFEHHANNTPPTPTIESCLFHALLKSRLVPSADGGVTAASWPGDDVVSYSKCGRTDKGVSSFGQVVGLRVRSARPEGVEEGEWDESKELPYVQMLNRLLPMDIRILAWCPTPPADFSARFSCRMRQYKYFFTNPVLPPLQGGKAKNGKPALAGADEPVYLDIEKMREAARLYEGEHDFRNFCKLDVSKQLDNFQRKIFFADIEETSALPPSFNGITPAITAPEGSSGEGTLERPRVYVFNLHGTAFLWHQVRHMVAVLFAVGQGLEKPSIITELFDVEKNPTKPQYNMADDRPLVLWDCVFPEDLEWKYESRDLVKEGRDKFVIDRLWELWSTRKMEELLAAKLAERVYGDIHGTEPLPLFLPSPAEDASKTEDQKLKDRRSGKAALNVDGSAAPGLRGKYKPIMQRARMETVEVLNERYRVKKGIPERAKKEELE